MHYYSDDLKNPTDVLVLGAFWNTIVFKNFSEIKE
jgi:hypothetical protein